MKTILGYTFKDPSLLKQALSHPSTKNETNNSNERLEFLGDAVLSMVVSEILYREFPDKEEGQLSIIKSEIISRSILSTVALAEKLEKEIILGKGIKQISSSMLANTLEAILGAIYLDGGLEAVREIVNRLFLDRIRKVAQQPNEVNYKASLQQYTQKYFKLIPKYHIVSISGSSHSPIFEVTVKVNNQIYGVGSGRTKKQAEQNAAKEALKKLEINYL